MQNSLFAGACCAQLLVAHQLSYSHDGALADAAIIHKHLELAGQQGCALVDAVADNHLAALGLVGAAVLGLDVLHICKVERG